MVTMCQGMAYFLKTYQKTGKIDRNQSSGRHLKASTEVKEIVEEQMRRDDKNTAISTATMTTTIKRLYTCTYTLSLSTILCWK